MIEGNPRPKLAPNINKVGELNMSPISSRHLSVGQKYVAHSKMNVYGNVGGVNITPKPTDYRTTISSAFRTSDPDQGISPAASSVQTVRKG